MPPVYKKKIKILYPSPNNKQIHGENPENYKMPDVLMPAKNPAHCNLASLQWSPLNGLGIHVYVHNQKESESILKMKVVLNCVQNQGYCRSE